MIERRVSVAQDEVETLNADVMRFMAILGLCLMLIFAAMEGARVSLQEQSQNTAHLMNKKINEGVIENIEQEAQKKFLLVEQEKKKLMQVLTQIKQKNRALKDSQQELQKVIQQKNTKIQEQKNKLRLNQNNEQKVRQNIKQLKQNLITTKLELMNANKNYQLKTYEHKQKNQAAKKKIKQMKPITKQENLLEKKVLVKKSSESIKTEKKGFVLRFSNDDAFVKLLKKKQIQLIYIADGIHYIVEHSSMIATQLLQGNHQMYALNNETVPMIYQQALSNRNNEKWGVILPHQIRQRLQTLMQNNKAGEIEIHSTGEVSINVAEF